MNSIEDLLNTYLIPDLVNIVIEYTNENRDNYNLVVEQLNVMNKQISLEGLIDVNVQLFLCLSYNIDDRYYTE